MGHITDTTILAYGIVFVIATIAFLLVAGSTLYTAIADRRDGYTNMGSIDPLVGTVFAVAPMVMLVSGGIVAKGLLA